MKRFKVYRFYDPCDTENGPRLEEEFVGSYDTREEAKAHAGDGFRIEEADTDDDPMELFAHLYSLMDASLTELYKVKLIEFIRSHDEPGLETFVTLHEEDDIIAVSAYSSEVQNEALLDDVARQLWTKGQFAGSVLLAMGERQEDILGLRTSLLQAQTALQYGFLYPDRILRYADFLPYETAETSLACAHGDRVFSILNDLSTPQAKEAVTAYLQEMRAQLYEQPFSYRYLHFVLLDILMSCVEIVKSAAFLSTASTRGRCLSIMNKQRHSFNTETFCTVF